MTRMTRSEIGSQVRPTPLIPRRLGRRARVRRAGGPRRHRPGSPPGRLGSTVFVIAVPSREQPSPLGWPGPPSCMVRTGRARGLEPHCIGSAGAFSHRPPLLTTRRHHPPPDRTPVAASRPAWGSCRIPGSSFLSTLLYKSLFLSSLLPLSCSVTLTLSPPPSLLLGLSHFLFLSLPPHHPRTPSVSFARSLVLSAFL